MTENSNPYIPPEAGLLAIEPMGNSGDISPQRPLLFHFLKLPVRQQIKHTRFGILFASPLILLLGFAAFRTIVHPKLFTFFPVVFLLLFPTILYLIYSSYLWETEYRYLDIAGRVVISFYLAAFWLGIYLPTLFSSMLLDQTQITIHKKEVVSFYFFFLLMSIYNFTMGTIINRRMGKKPTSALSA